jgi:hypothetical protein
MVTAPVMVCVGFLGARLDHSVAAMSAVTRHGSSRVLLLGAEDVCILCPPDLSLALPMGARGHAARLVTGAFAGGRGCLHPMPARSVPGVAHGCARVAISHGAGYGPVRGAGMAH